jgi:hypothetical protein
LEVQLPPELPDPPLPELLLLEPAPPELLEPTPPELLGPTPPELLEPTPPELPPLPVPLLPAPELPPLPKPLLLAPELLLLLLLTPELLLLTPEPLLLLTPELLLLTPEPLLLLTPELLLLVAPELAPAPELLPPVSSGFEPELLLPHPVLSASSAPKAVAAIRCALIHSSWNLQSGVLASVRPP